MIKTTSSMDLHMHMAAELNIVCFFLFFFAELNIEMYFILLYLLGDKPFLRAAYPLYTDYKYHTFFWILLNLWTTVWNMTEFGFWFR